jgi:membrane dipeptidase
MTVLHHFTKGLGSTPNPLFFFPDANATWSNLGLTDFGVDVVRSMQDLGIIIDVTHATPRSVQDILGAVSCPVLASHSAAKNLAEHPYNLYDEHIKEIASRGGIIGVVLAPGWAGNFSKDNDSKLMKTLPLIVDTVVYIAKIAGTKHVGIGSDYAGYISGPSEMPCLGNISQFRELLEKEFSHQETEDIMANNGIRFISENWKVMSNG